MRLSNEAGRLFGLAQTHYAAHDFPAALDEIQKSVQILDIIRGRVVSPDLRTSFTSSVQREYEFFIDLLMQMHAENPHGGFDRSALVAAERFRARSLVEALTRPRSASTTKTDSRLLERERVVRQQLSAKVLEQAGYQLSARDSNQQKKEPTDTDLLLAEYYQLQEEIAAVQPPATGPATAGLLTAADICGLLDDDTILLETYLGTTRSYLWAVTRTEITSYPMAPRADIEKNANRLYRSIRERTTDWERSPAAAYLAHCLLQPAASKLGHRRLVLVTDGVLQYIPFAILPSPNTGDYQGVGRSIVEDHEIVSLPSASALAALRRRVKKAPSQSVIVLADPVFDQGDPRLLPSRSQARSPFAALRLPFSREEAEGVVRKFDRASLLTGFDASRESVMNGGLDNYRIIHFATHLVDNEHPELSGLLLSAVGRDGSTKDSLLTLADVYSLNLSAELVVLSTGPALGKEVAGEGSVGLARGFMYAGVPRVITSSWVPEDQSTAQFMERFYQHFRASGQPASALRATQLEMIRMSRYARSPYYWANFVLQGEWR